MKNLFILLVVLFSCTPTATESNNAITSEEEQIAKDLIQGAFDDLWGGVDSTKMSLYHTDDFIILEQGKIWDNERIKKFMRDQLAKPDRPLRINKMDYISINKYGESMQIAYHNYAEFMKADTLWDKASWLESALAIKTDKGWRLKMMHSTWGGKDF